MMSNVNRIAFNEYVKWMHDNQDSRLKMACAAHAAATARANSLSGMGVEEGAAPKDVCPDTVPSLNPNFGF